MERLTEKVGDGVQLKKCGNSICMAICNSKKDCSVCPIDEAFKKLADYEIAEEQGLLVRLPCKVGTEVYYILGIPNKTPCTIDKCVFKLSDVHKIGESLFLTREEAEKKLEEMKK